MNSKHVKAASVLTLVTVLGCMLAGCSTSSLTPSLKVTSHPVSSDPPASTPPYQDPHITLACGLVGEIETTVENAMAEKQNGTISNDGYRAILAMVPISLKLVKGNPDAGLQSQVWDLNEAVTVGAAVSGSVFDPSSPDYRKSISAISDACASNGTGLMIYMATGG